MKDLYKKNKVYPVRSQLSKMTASSNGGFTLIEILVVIGILTVILAFGMTVNFSAFTSGTLAGEESKIVSVLQRARSHAMANMFESKYGVCYSSNKDSYIIFRENEGICDDTEPTNELIPANTNIAEHADTNFSDFPVVFDQLSGNADNAIIHITDGTKSEDIEINEKGTINW